MANHKIVNWFWSCKLVNLARQISKAIILPGFEGMSLYVGLKFMYEAFTRSDIALKSAAISFKFFIALFPTVILILSLIPYVPIQNFQEDLLGSIYLILPDSVNDIVKSTINDLVLKKQTGVLSVGFVLTLYYASSIINSILDIFSKSYQIKKTRHPLKQRLVSFLMMFVITIMMLVGFALVFTSSSLIEELLNDYVSESVSIFYLVQLGKWLAIMLLFILSISTLYNVAFIERKRWKVMSAGASMATTFIIVASLGMSMYFNNFDSYNKLYGSIGSLLVFLLWMNISSTLLIMGFELYAEFKSLMQLLVKQ